MYTLLAQLADAEALYLEPSALAGMYGPVLTQPGSCLALTPKPPCPPVRWQRDRSGLATGGKMVPRKEMQRDDQKGRALAQG